VRPCKNIFIVPVGFKKALVLFMGNCSFRNHWMSPCRRSGGGWRSQVNLWSDSGIAMIAPKLATAGLVVWSLVDGFCRSRFRG
jgi:hypothetical protein